jgi:hypothetical protein
MGALSNLIPLIVLFLVVGGGAYIGYQIYMWSNEMTDRGKKHSTYTDGQKGNSNHVVATWSLTFTELT